MRLVQTLLLAALSGSCSQSTASTDAQAPLAPRENWQRDLLRTDLSFDIEARSAEAILRFADQQGPGASLEVGSMQIISIQSEGQPLPFQRSGDQLDLALPGDASSDIQIAYRFTPQEGFEGYRSAGSTLTWPTWCGNLFPCKSDPAEGARYSVTTTGVPRGESVIQTPPLETEAPAYMVAFAHGIYEYLSRGPSAAGTEAGVYYLPGGLSRAESGSTFLVDYLDFYESHYGPYAFGSAVAAVEVQWGAGANGGMEHHPFFHVSTGAMSNHEVLAHEVAHAWFGNGVRIACWEDLVLSEGVAQYLTLRAIEEAEGIAAADTLWATIDARLRNAVATGDTLAYPPGCQDIDILNTPLVSRIPYEKGAFFLRAVERQIERATLDAALASFYQERLGSAAHMSDLLAHIESESGQDIEPLASAWLRELGIPTI